MENKAVVCPGKTLLKVVGIILIVFGAIALIISILGLAAGGLVSYAGANVGYDELSEALKDTGVPAEAVSGLGAVAIAIAVITLISSIYNLVLGILGVKYCARPEKARLLLILGVISLVLAAIGLIGGFDWINLLSLVLPVLYVVGAGMNGKAA